MLGRVIASLTAQRVLLTGVNTPALSYDYSSAAPSLQLAVPLTPPSSASQPIDPSYLGFAFEQASFYNFSIDSSGNPNLFSQNLIDAVLSRTGGTPILRVGGTSGDQASYDANQTEITNRPATEGGPAFTAPYLIVNSEYWNAFKTFPDAEYIFMVPLALRNLTATLQWTAKGLSVIGNRLQALEIGNEADLYNWYTIEDYISEFEEFAQALTSNFSKQLSGVIYQALDTASGGSAKLSVEKALTNGINATQNVKQVAFHYYQVDDRPGTGLKRLQSSVANHTAIVAEMEKFAIQIQYLRAHAPQVPFILSEVGNSLGSGDIHQRNILATALWNVDYQLHGMTIGVYRVNNQQIVYPGYQMWEPVSSGLGPALVRANFYSQPLVAEFIGKATTSNGTATRVLELDTNNDFLSAYAAYDGDKLARLAIVNFVLWTPLDGARPSISFAFKDLHGRSTAKVSTLTAPEGAFANSTLTYAGLQWTYESQGKQTLVGAEPSTLTITDGILRLDVEATTALLIDLS